MTTSFTDTEEFKELNSELHEAYQDGEFEDAWDIFLEIHQGITNFNSNLPDWYQIRWRMKESSPDVFKSALEEYNKKILNALDGSILL